MSHGIMSQDRVYSIEPTWHKLETIVASITREGIAPMLFELIRRKLSFADTRELITAEALVPSNDMSHILNIVEDSYASISNAQLFDVLSNALPKGARIVTCGTLWDRHSVFFSIELAESARKGPRGEEYRTHFILSARHDGGEDVSFFDCSLRVVCANTLAMAKRERGSAKGRVSLKHSKFAQLRLVNFEQSIADLFERTDARMDALAKLDTKPVSLGEARNFAAGFIAPSAGLSTRSFNQVETVTGFFSRGIGNRGETRYDLLNAGTQYWTRGDGSADTDRMKLFQSSEFGGFADRKADWFATLADDKEFKLTTQRGASVLAAWNS